MSPNTHPWSHREQFPLGRPLGLLEATTDTPTEPTERPFGLRFATAHRPGSVVELDTSALHYDRATQTTMIREGETLSPVFKHTSDKTKTSTGSHDRDAADNDEDAGGD